MKLKSKKTAILSLAVLLPVALYIAGVVAQFITNVSAWKAAGADYRSSPGLPSLLPLDCLKALLHVPEGLIALAAVAGGIALFCVFGLRLGWGVSGTTDTSRNLTISNSAVTVPQRS